MGSLHVKFHDDRCKGKAVMRRKPKYGRHTDGQTDMVIPVYPPNFVAGGGGGYNNHVYSISGAEQSKVPAFGVESC